MNNIENIVEFEDKELINQPEDESDVIIEDVDEYQPEDEDDFSIEDPDEVVDIMTRSFIEHLC